MSTDALRWERRARELLQHVATETARARDLPSALTVLLDAVCAHTGWPVGHVFVRDGDQLVSGRLWHLEDPLRYATFRRISEGFVFNPGVGMPGRVLATRRPLWINDVMKDPNFPRAKLASDLGIHAGLGFPVIAGGEVLAVMEFFAPVAVEPDEPLLEVMASLGHQLGHLHDRLQADARLAASEARFRAVTESATDAIVTVDAVGCVVSWNAAAERMFGWTAADMTGVLLERIVPERFRAAHRNGMARLAAGGAPRVVGSTVELAGVRRDGSEFPLELSLGRWEAEGARFYTGVLRDVTRRREAERMLREQADRLDRQNEELGTKNLELVRQRETLLESWRQMERVFTAFADALPGQELDGRYRLEARIGSGGYGVVYRALDLRNSEAVAVKVFRPANGRLSPDHVARFRREGPTATRVAHPNAVKVLDSGVSSAGIPYLVMELLHGPTLAERLRGLGALPAPEAVGVLAAVADAVAAAHDAGIVHRDIKPDNVLLHAGSPKLLDFGIARLLDDTGDAALDTVTHTGQMIGTPAYMAPERLEGAPYDGRSDVYSLGVMLFEALTGVRPFSAGGGTPWEVLRRQAEGQLPNLADHLPGAPDALTGLVSAALARDPSARPSARRMVAVLRDVPPFTLNLPAPARPSPRVPTPAGPTMDVEE